MKLKIAIAALVLSVTSCAQTKKPQSKQPTQGTIDQAWTTAFGGGATATATAITRTGDVVWSSGGSGTLIMGNGVIVETRKIKTPLPTIQQVRLRTKTVEPATTATTAYLKLAKHVGLKSASTDELQMLAAIHDAGCKVYDFDMVDDFLYNQALSMSAQTRWVWKPMREADLKTVSANSHWGTTPNVGMLYPKLYQRAVPITALAHAETILKAIPEAVFMVSDFEVVKPDPFLAVTTPLLLKEGKIFIIDQWDEPAFSKFETGDDIAPKLKLSPTI